MQKSDVIFQPAGAAFEMHKARHVGRDDEVRAATSHETDFVVSHFCGDSFFRYGKCSAESTAFVDSLEVGELDAADAFEQSPRFGEFAIVDPFAHRRHLQTANGRTTGV